MEKSYPKAQPVIARPGIQTRLVCFCFSTKDGIMWAEGEG